MRAYFDQARCRATEVKALQRIHTLSQARNTDKGSVFPREHRHNNAEGVPVPIRLYRKRTPPLGDLERDVMECIWSTGSESAQSLHETLQPIRAITLSTVQSTVERLVRKGLLLREKRHRAYHYLPALSRSALLARMVAELVSDLSDSRTAATSGLIDIDDAVDEGTLRQLEQWVSERRAAQDKS